MANPELHKRAISYAYGAGAISGAEANLLVAEFNALCAVAKAAELYSAAMHEWYASPSAKNRVAKGKAIAAMRDALAPLQQLTEPTDA